MKKKIISLMLCILLAFTFVCPVFAADEDVPFNYMVVDTSELLTQNEAAELNARAWAITQEYECAVYIITTPSTEGLSVAEYNEFLHSTLDMGYGSDRSCIILLLDTDYREYDIMAHGYGNIAFSDYAKDAMAEEFLDDFRYDYWYDGFVDYLDCCEEYLELAARGTPLDYDSRPRSLIGLALCILGPCLIALIVCSVFASQMKTAGIQKRASNYIADPLNLYNRNDIYLNTQRTRRYIEPKNKSGSRSGGGGSSHKSGRF
jgi:uncharacterized membrane protein YgcG